jgi:hypothetical protein
LVNLSFAKIQQIIEKMPKTGNIRGSFQKNILSDYQLFTKQKGHLRVICVFMDAIPIKKMLIFAVLNLKNASRYHVKAIIILLKK